MKLRSVDEASVVEIPDRTKKIVVLIFWASWCAPCVKELQEESSYKRRYPNWGENVRFITASVDDSKQSAAKFLQGKSWTFAEHCWASEDDRRAYHVNAVPCVYIMDQEGDVLDSGFGLDVPAIIS